MARITHTVGEHEVVFKSIPMRTSMKFRTFTKGTEAVSKLVSKWINSKTEITSESEHLTEYREDGSVSRAHVHTKPIDPQMAAKNQRELEVGVKNLVELCFSLEAEDMIAEIITKTAINFPVFEGMTDDQKKDAILDELDPGELMELIIGALKATRGIADVLGKLLGLKQDTVDLLKSKVKAVVTPA